MLNKILSYLFPEYISPLATTKIAVLTTKLNNLKYLTRTQQSQIDKLEVLLVQDISTDIAKTLYVTDHAVSRYRQRIGCKLMPKEDLRKHIYKLAMRNLATLDSLPDGEYELGHNAVCRVKDHTITTVVPRRGSKKK